MGNTPFEIEARKTKRLLREKEERKMANDLADQITDLINAKVIRPGPKPEERECTDVASEIRALRPEIVGIILRKEG